MPRAADTTIHAVAERVGVSISTVSLAFNHPQRVNEATRQRILDAAGELGYQPARTPSARAKKGVSRIATFAPFSSYESYRRRLMGILEACSARGIEVSVFDHEAVVSSASPLLDSLPLRGDIDGIIVMGLPFSPSGAERILKWGAPVVTVDLLQDFFSQVLVDDEHGGYLAGRHLIERGHRRIGFLHERQRSSSYISAGMLRRDGVARALDEVGGNDAGYVLIDCEIPDGKVESAQKGLAGFLSGPKAPTAFFGNHDDLAAGVLAGLRELDAKAAEGIAVLGYDDGPLADALQLSTVRQPFEESGRVAAKLLFDLIESPGSARQTISLTPELVIRSSS
ncbi:LacI family transcriptional regulator [Psychromicrobium silvestre]|uniref:LacI family transcriptional regulator n=1 Tax=Psychromicrobium silvestre TaxID=1645614 RepID=A0A7Y9LQW0_9MICC|nr:LacI family DNA-binding transcriptional regulator [Psychromicrobium silvestre]NYE93932.1 LacI family transcriptional regulator [Psychromicrobium silvestre]